MMRYLLLLLFLLAVGCNKETETSTKAVTSDEDLKLARAFIERIKKDQGYFLGDSDAVARVIAKDQVDAHALLRGVMELLHHGKPEERPKAAYFLGRLGNSEAIGPLVKTLDDPDEELRESACLGLQWLHAKGEPAESALVKLRRHDPSADVRVAAAVALNQPTDEDTLAAFKLGLKSAKKRWVRETCEDELENQGKLELPLPDHVYSEITYDFYQQIKADRGWYMVKHEIRKADIIYLEVTERIHHVPLHRDWYRTKVVAPAPEGQSKTNVDEMKANSLTLKGHKGIVHCLAFSPDEKQLASAGEDGTIRIWESNTGNAVHSLTGHTGAVLRLVFSQDGNRLMSAGRDRTVRIWNSSTGKTLLTLQEPTNFAVDSVSFSADGKHILATSHGGTLLKVWHSSTGNEIRLLKFLTSIGSGIVIVAFSQDAKRIAMANEKSQVLVCDVDKGNEIIKLKTSDIAFFLAFSPDARSLLCGGLSTAVFDLSTGKEIGDPQPNPARPAADFAGQIFAVAYSKDGKRFATVNALNGLKVWEVSPRKEICSFQVPGGQVLKLAMTSDAKRIATADWDKDGVVTVWNTSALFK